MTAVQTILRVSAVLSIITLTACTGTTQYSLLDRAATAADDLPASIVNSDTKINPTSSRFIGLDDGRSFWLVAPKDAPGICLAVAQDEEQGLVACGGSALEVDLGLGAHYAVYPDGMPDKEGLRRISDNVFAFTG